MFDLIKLEKIKDPEKKNEALEKIGTQNFDYLCNSIIEQQNVDEQLDTMERQVSTFAKRLDEYPPPDEYRTEKLYHAYNYESATGVTIPEDKKEYYYVRTPYGITVFVPIEFDEAKEKKKKEEEKRKEEIAERIAKLDAISRAMYKTRFEFIKKQTSAGLKKHESYIFETVIEISLFRDYVSPGDLCAYLGVSLPKNISSWDANFRKIINQTIADAVKTEGALKVSALVIYTCYDNKGVGSFYDYQGKYIGSDKVERLYEYLENIGYEMSDEERRILDGTHELYTKEDDE